MLRQELLDSGGMIVEEVEGAVLPLGKGEIQGIDDEKHTPSTERDFEERGRQGEDVGEVVETAPQEVKEHFSTPPPISSLGSRQVRWIFSAPS